MAGLLYCLLGWSWRRLCGLLVFVFWLGCGLCVACFGFICVVSWVVFDFCWMGFSCCLVALGLVFDFVLWFMFVLLSCYVNSVVYVVYVCVLYCILVCCG